MADCAGLPSSGVFLGRMSPLLRSTLGHGSHGTRLPSVPWSQQASLGSGRQARDKNPYFSDEGGPGIQDSGYTFRSPCCSSTQAGGSGRLEAHAHRRVLPPLRTAIARSLCSFSTGVESPGHRGRQAGRLGIGHSPLHPNASRHWPSPTTLLPTTNPKSYFLVPPTASAWPCRDPLLFALPGICSWSPATSPL